MYLLKQDLVLINALQHTNKEENEIHKLLEHSMYHRSKMCKY